MLSPTQLELEITESSILEPDARTLDLLTRLRVLGVRLAIDDFGMGHTSLRYIRTFPVTTVKVDRSLTESLNSNVQEQIVRSILDLSRSLRITTVVEGVEDEQQLRVFTGIGYPYAFQGYYFSRPLSSADCLGFCTALQRANGSGSLRQQVGVFFALCPKHAKGPGITGA